MEPFSFIRAKDISEAINSAGSDQHAKFLAGSTNLVDLMRRDVEKPTRIVDINDLSLRKIEHNGKTTMIGALVSNTDLAFDTGIRKNFPVLSEAILSGASPQIRNMATAGGNILQRTRCPYFYDTVFPCNKRNPGSGCSAIQGYNRMHAILGTSDKCIAAHPSDMCVALIALEAVIHVQGIDGQRKIPFTEFHLVPGDTPEKENLLRHGDIITHIELPHLSFSARSHYLKVRDRASFEFALVSAAVALDIQNGVIRASRIAMGGVGTKPWRAFEAEKILEGGAADDALFSKAADAVMTNAKPHEFNAFKVELGKRTLVSALKTIGGMA